MNCDLPYLIECKSFAKFFEPIAAFNDKTVAERYMIDCQTVNRQFTYRLKTLKD